MTGVQTCALPICRGRSCSNRCSIAWGVSQSRYGVANEEPDREYHSNWWQFGFKSQNVKNKRIHLEAIIPIAEDYFTFELRYYPEVRLHDEPKYSGPNARLEVSGIQEKHLKDLQKYINYLLNIA